MKKSLKSVPATTTELSVAATTAIPVAEQLGAIEKGLATIRSLTKKERTTLASRSNNVPDALITQMIQIAQKNGGLVAGIPLDVASAQAVLTAVSTAQAAVISSRTIAQKIEDGWIQQRVALADRVFGIHRALGRLVNTPEGNSLIRVHAEMVATVRNRPRKRKKAAKATSAKHATTHAAAPAAANGVATAATLSPALAPAPAPIVAEVLAPAPVFVAAPAAGAASHP